MPHACRCEYCLQNAATMKPCDGLHVLSPSRAMPVPEYNLGRMYANGEGVPKDFVEAVKWYRLAAEQGVAYAQYNLGYMYSSGEGVPKDFVEAVKWYRLAAEQGVAYAQYNLGLMYGPRVRACRRTLCRR